MMTTSAPNARRNRFTLLALIAIFAMPPFLGWLFIMNPQWLPSETVNNGILIHPPRPVTGLRLSKLENGQPLNWEELRDKWVFVAVNRGDCDQQCISRLINIRQLRRALGAESKRVARILILLPDSAGRTPDAPPMEGLEGTSILLADNSDVANELVSLFDLEQIEDSNQLFIVDPRGDLMMRHNLATLKPKEILKDLELLLKASANWVQGDQ
ncbi:MAG: hypothetical protein KDI43_08380 [Gammaproteobacteria bacterium]|nr:hypothetical protein [Gammaproteobacteria bacterium]MCP5407578.1 hypothetical protein [Chromatiaceae bacterium]MCP5441852.1 hypothetical protein [Chromatiaceae bacterium]